MAELKPGLVGEFRRVVEEPDTAHALGNIGVYVFSTPTMISWMESASGLAVHSHLAPGQGTVGTHLDVRHLAATPAGMHVTVRSVLAAVDGRKLTFHVEAYDEKEKIGEGTHERFIVEMAQFMERVNMKRATPRG